MAINKFLAVGTSWNNPANWSLGSVPSPFDIATFDSLSGDCNIDVNANISEIDMQASYSDTLTQNNTFELFLSGQFDQFGGSFLGGNSDITINGKLTLGAGVSFTSTSAKLQVTGQVDIASGTFTHNSGMFKFVNLFSTGLRFNGNTAFDFEFDCNPNAYITFNSDIIIANKLLATEFGNHLGTGDIICLGDFTTLSSPASFRPIMIDGTTPQQLDAGGGSGNMGRLTFKNTTSMVTIKDHILVKGHLKADIGSLIDATTFLSTIELTNGSTTIDLNGAELHNLTIGSNSVFGTNIGVTIVNGTFEIKLVTLFSGGIFELKGDYISSDLVVGGSSAIIFSGSSDQLWSGFDFIAGLISINKPSGKVVLGSDVVLTSAGNDIIIEKGILDLGAFNLTSNGDLSLNGGGVISTTGILDMDKYFLAEGVLDPFKAVSSSTLITILFTDSPDVQLMPSGGEFEFTGANSWIIDQNFTQFPKLVFNKCPSCNQLGQWYAQDVEIRNGSEWGHGFIRGNVLSDGYNFADSGDTHTFDGVGDQQVDGNVTFGRLILNKISGSLKFNDDFRLSQCEVIAGASLVNFGTSTAHILELVSNLAGADWLVAGLEFYSINLEISPNGTAEMNNTIALGDFTITQASVISGDLVVSGNWSTLDATISGGLTVIFDGVSDQTIFIQGGGGSGLDVSVSVNKNSGSIKQLSDVGSNTLDFVLLKGIWCTNEFDFTADDLTIINGQSEFQKTPSSIVTTNTTTGTINNVATCGKKNSIFLVV